jgi:hypothetical protein
MLLTLLALALRGSQLDQSLFGDELYAFWEIDARSFGGMLDTVTHSAEVTPPLFFALSWLSSQLGDPTIWLRLPSLVCGVLLVPLTYALGASMVGRLAALLGATVVTLAPFAIFYSVEARPYAVLVFATAASTLALMRAVDTNRPGWWTAYGLASLAGVYSHLTAIFVLVAQAAWAAYRHRHRLRGLLLANGLATVAFLPWVPRLFRDDVPALVSTYGRFDSSPLALGRVLAHVLPGYPFVPLDRVPGTYAAVAFAVAVAAVAAAALRYRPRLPALIVLPPAAVAAGLLAWSAVSGTGLFTPRTAITMLPYLALIIGALVAALPRRLHLLVSAAVVIPLAFGTAAVMGDDGQRPRFREAAAYVASRAGPGDVVMERELFRDLPPWDRHLTIYLPHDLPYARDGVDAVDDARRVFFVHVPVGLNPNAPAALGRDDRLVPVARRVLPGIHPVAVTTYAAPR